MGVVTSVETSTSPSQPSSSIKTSIPLETFITPDSPSVYLDSVTQDDIPEDPIQPSIVKKSKPSEVGRGIGFRSIPPFRKRVVSLPPVPIVTHQGLLEQRGKEKQVRFYTNVICHEYQSY